MRASSKSSSLRLALNQRDCTESVRDLRHNISDPMVRESKFAVRKISPFGLDAPALTCRSYVFKNELHTVTVRKVHQSFKAMTGVLGAITMYPTENDVNYGEVLREEQN